MKKLFFLLVALMTNVWCHAQEFELGKVTKEELMQTAHPREPDAPAAVLYHVGQTRMDYSDSEGFVLVTEASIRIKIYKKEGYEWANKSVDYYVGQNPVEHVNFSKAVTYNLVNGSVEKTKLKSEGEFEERTNKYWARKKITMPNVKEGSVIEYRYEISSPYMTNVPVWQFQSGIPVNYSKFVTKFPEYYTYKSNQKGFIFPVKTTSTETRTHNYTEKERSGGLVTSTSYSNGQFTYNENVSTYIARDMPSMKAESYVANIDNYISSIEHELAFRKLPGQEPKSYSTTWEDLAKTIYESPNFGEEIKKSGYFEDDLKTLTAGLSGDNEKIAAVFNFVRDRMNWNNYYGYSCDDGVRKAYKDKVGNVAEINLMLVAMLRQLGIAANPVLVSTRSNGISFFANRTAYNYVVCAIESNNDIVLLDATDKNALPNILPIRALNWYGRIVRENGSSAQVDLMPKTASKDVVNMIATLDAQGKLSGKLRDQYFDYNAFLFRRDYAKLAKESYLEGLEKRLDGIEIADDYAVTYDDLSKPVVENYSFANGNVSEIIGDKLYFSPMVFLAETDNPFKQEKREYPVDFVFPHQDKYTLSITLPDGYAIESVPAPAAVTLGENAGKYLFNISANGKQIQIVSVFEINEAIVSSENYQALRDFYKAMIDKQAEKIVLKKI